MGKSISCCLVCVSSIAPSCPFHVGLSAMRLHSPTLGDCLDAIWIPNAVARGRLESWKNILMFTRHVQLKQILNLYLTCVNCHCDSVYKLCNVQLNVDTYKQKVNSVFKKKSEMSSLFPVTSKLMLTPTGKGSLVFSRQNFFSMPGKLKFKQAYIFL